MAALAGDFEDCRRLSRQAAEIAADWQDTSVRFTQLGQTISLALLRGDPAEMMPGWEDFLPGVRDFPPVARAGMAVALLLAGRRDAAVALYQPLLNTVTDLKRGLAAAALAFLKDLAPALGDATACRAVRDVISGLFEGSDAMGAGTVFYDGSVGRTLGELDLGCGEPAAAIPHFEEGLRVDTLLGARPYIARGRMGLAQALAATNDLPQAVKLARAAAADARLLDMPGLLHTADKFLADAVARAHAEDPLTPREREVVDLVAQALSNKAIADKLVLSERTVESHVSRILAKTGLTTRTELTRWFLRRP
jgi:DNA-binding CsgD family transcriptional regulator